MKNTIRTIVARLISGFVLISFICKICTSISLPAFSLQLPQIASALSFGYNWTFYAVPSSFLGSSMIKFYDSQQMTSNKAMTYNIQTFRFWTLYTWNSINVLVKSNDGKFGQLLQMNSFSSKYRLSTTPPNKIVDSVLCSMGFAYFLQTNGIQRLTTSTSYMYTFAVFTSTSITPLQILEWQLNKLVVNFQYSANESKGVIQIYNQYGIVLNSIQYNVSNASQCNLTAYDRTKDMLILLCPALIQIYSLKAASGPYMVLNMQSNQRLYGANICGDYLALLHLDRILFYSIITKNLTFMQPLNVFQKIFVFVGQLKCFTYVNWIGFQGVDSNGYRAVHYLNFDFNSTTNNISQSMNQTTPANTTTNTSTSSNTSTTINSTLNTTTPTAQTPQLQFLPPPPIPATTQLFLQIKYILQLPAVNQSLTIAASSVSVAASSSFIRQFVTPFVYLLEQLWFYGFHSVQYCQLIQLFANQADILNQLKIKPTFLQSLNPEIPLLSQQNSQSLQSFQFHLRIPPTIFFLESIKSIYTSTLLLTLLQFILACLLRYVLGKMVQWGKLFEIAYHFMSHNSIWFVAIVGIVQNNIAFLGFYASYQFLGYGFHDWFGRVNGIIAVIVFLVVFVYSYAFYSFIYTYEKNQKSKGLLHVSNFSHTGFLLQTTLNCFRRLNVSFIHGVFTNSHLIQLMALICLDLTILIIIIKLRHSFSNKLIGLLTFANFVAFLLLDCTLIIGTEALFKDNLEQYRNNQVLNYISIVIVIAICSITLLRIICDILITIVSAILKFKNSQSNNSQIGSSNGINKIMDVNQHIINILQLGKSKNIHLNQKSLKRKRDIKTQKQINSNTSTSRNLHFKLNNNSNNNGNSQARKKFNYTSSKCQFNSQLKQIVSMNGVDQQPSKQFQEYLDMHKQVDYAGQGVIFGEQENARIG